MFNFCWNKVFHKHRQNIKFQPNQSNIFIDTLSTKAYQDECKHRGEGKEGAKIYMIQLFLKLCSIFSKFCWTKYYPFNIFEDMLSTRFYQQKHMTMNVNIKYKDKKAGKYR